LERKKRTQGRSRAGGAGSVTREQSRFVDMWANNLSDQIDVGPGMRRVLPGVLGYRHWSVGAICVLCCIAMRWHAFLGFFVLRRPLGSFLGVEKSRGCVSWIRRERRRRSRTLMCGPMSEGDRGVQRVLSSMDPVKQVKEMGVGQEAQVRVYWQATGYGPRTLFRYFFFWKLKRNTGKVALLLLNYSTILLRTV
jgi:hypothetical protein